MKKFEKIAVSAIVLSVASILTVVAMIAMWICESRKICVVELDSFVGIIVALLAIIVTFVLGWQIFNIFELKHKIDEMSELKSQFLEQKEDISQLTFKTKHLTGFTWAKTANKEKNYITAFRFGLMSLENALQLKTPINVPNLLKLLKSAATMMGKDSQCNKSCFDEIENIYKSIQSFSNYNLIQNEIEDIYKTAVSKLKIKE